MIATFGAIFVLFLFSVMYRVIQPMLKQLVGWDKRLCYRCRAFQGR